MAAEEQSKQALEQKTSPDTRLNLMMLSRVSRHKLLDVVWYIIVSSGNFPEFDSKHALLYWSSFKIYLLIKGRAHLLSEY